MNAIKTIKDAEEIGIDVASVKNALFSEKGRELIEVFSKTEEFVLDFLNEVKDKELINSYFVYPDGRTVEGWGDLGGWFSPSQVSGGNNNSRCESLEKLSENVWKHRYTGGTGDGRALFSILIFG